MKEKATPEEIIEARYGKPTRGDWWRIIRRRSQNRWGGPSLPWNLPGDDHCQLYKAEDGTLTWLSQPYGVSSQTAAEMVKAAEEYGLTFQIGATSPYYQGATVSIAWRKK